MSNSPFDLFRRNLKPLMVFLTGVALFAFVVLPVLDTYMRRNVGTLGNEVVATYDGANLTRNRVEYFTRNHQSTIRFLVELAQETIDRGGSPQTAGFSYDTQTRRVNSIGINEVPSFEGSMRTLMLASQAQKDGFELDDSTLSVWLQEFTNGMIPEGEINSMLMRSTQNQMGRPHLYEQLRNHLLARVYEERGLSGIFMGQGPMSGPLMTPEEQWSNFLKLNRSAVASAYGVLVSDYLPQTNASPTESEIKAVYEEGKDRNPNDQLPDPAFHRPYAATIEYVSADYQAMLDAEVAKLDEAAIRGEYERRLKGGEFQLPAAPPVSTNPLVPGAEATTPAEATDPADPTDPTDPADPADPADPTNPGATNDDPASEPAEPAPQSSLLRDSSVRLVTFQQEAESPAPAEASAETSSAETTPPATETQPETPSDAAAGADAPSQTPAVTTDAATAATTDEKVETPRVEPFEAVRDRIARQMVEEQVRKNIDTAMTEIGNRMRRYFSENAIYQSNAAVGQTGTAGPPKRPDLAQLAKDYGFQYEQIGPYNASSIRDEPVAQSLELGSQFMGQSPGFVQLMFAGSPDRPETPSQPLFAPVRTADGSTGKQYVAWKVEETPAYTPSLDEVRDEVVMAIRMKEARKLAREAAEAIAKQASGGDGSKTLKDLVPTDKADNFKEDLGPFTWMDSFGFQGATIGNVPELDSVGNDFMKAVFEGGSEKLRVAENSPGRVVYVIEPKSYQPGMEELRRQFKQPTNRMMAMLLGNGAGPLLEDYFEGLDDKAKFKDLSAIQTPQP